MKVKELCEDTWLGDVELELRSGHPILNTGLVPLHCTDLHSFPKAAMINYHKPGRLNYRSLFFLQLWRPEAPNQGAGSAGFFWKL